MVKLHVLLPSQVDNYLSYECLVMRTTTSGPQRFCRTQTRLFDIIGDTSKYLFCSSSCFMP